MTGPTLLPAPDDDSELAEVVADERALMDPSVRSASDAAGRLLAGDAREFGSSGAVYDRDALLALLADEEPFAPPEEMTDIDARRLAQNVILLTYRTVRPGRATLRSSIWRQDPEGWRIVFHQGTPVHR